MTVALLTAAGTWADMFTGYPADTARGLTSEWDHIEAELMGLDGPRFRFQPINYPAVGFLNPDPNTSYNESVELGVTEGVRLARLEPVYDLVGYSQGAEVVVRIAEIMAAEGHPPRRIVTFGSPCRHPGPTLVGNNPAGSGISRYYGPPELFARTTDIVRNKGEMYGCAPDDTYLPEFYELFVQAETSLTFFAAALQFAMPYIAGGLGGVLAGNPFAVIGTVDIPKAIKTGIVLVDFASTQAHTSYHLPASEFGGRTGIQVAIDALTR